MIPGIEKPPRAGTTYSELHETARHGRRRMRSAAPSRMYATVRPPPIREYMLWILRHMLPRAGASPSFRLFCKPFLSCLYDCHTCADGREVESRSRLLDHLFHKMGENHIRIVLAQLTDATIYFKEHIALCGAHAEQAVAAHDACHNVFRPPGRYPEPRRRHE